MSKAILVIDIPDDRKPEEYTVDRIWEYVPDEDDDRPYALYFRREKDMRFKPMPIRMSVRDELSDKYGLRDNPYCQGWNDCLEEIEK